jgi:hypothetical protein
MDTGDLEPGEQLTLLGCLQALKGEQVEVREILVLEKRAQILARNGRTAWRAHTCGDDGHY